MIHIVNGRLRACGTQEIVIRRLLKLFKIDMDEFERRISRPSQEWIEKQAK